MERNPTVKMKLNLSSSYHFMVRLEIKQNIMFFLADVHKHAEHSEKQPVGWEIMALWLPLLPLAAGYFEIETLVPTYLKKNICISNAVFYTSSGFSLKFLLLKKTTLISFK